MASLAENHIFTTTKLAHICRGAYRQAQLIGAVTDLQEGLNAYFRCMHDRIHMHTHIYIY